MTNDFFAESILKETMRQVELDEAETIRILNSLLDQIQQTGKTEHLTGVRVLKDWQNQPPRDIGKRLKEIADQID